jgi:hypothetical protein
VGGCKGVEAVGDRAEHHGGAVRGTSHRTSSLLAAATSACLRSSCRCWAAIWLEIIGFMLTTLRRRPISLEGKILEKHV